MHKGSCHCGAIQYQFDGDIGDFLHCHCHTCRKINGTVYGSSAIAPRDKFSVTASEDALTAYESAPGKKRCFCRHCGTHVFATMEYRPEVVVLRIGTLDDDPGGRPEGHIWVSDKAPWYEITDGLPQYEGWRDG